MRGAPYIQALGLWGDDADDVAGKGEGVVPMADWTGPRLPAVGLARPIQFVFQAEHSSAVDARNTKGALRRRHRRGAILLGWTRTGGRSFMVQMCSQSSH